MALDFLRHCAIWNQVDWPHHSVTSMSVVKQEFCGRKKNDFISVLSIRNEKKVFAIFKLVYGAGLWTVVKILK